jgi:hypothetical protein
MPTHLAGKKPSTQNRPHGGTIRVVFVKRAVREAKVPPIRTNPNMEDITESNSRRPTYAYSFSGRSRWNILGYRGWDVISRQWYISRTANLLVLTLVGGRRNQVQLGGNICDFLWSDILVRGITETCMGPGTKLTVCFLDLDR